MDTTKEKILAAATNIFIHKGFSGTSISEIARQADINQSLIYHHIGNKRDLWKAVKLNLIKEKDDSDLRFNNFKDFVKHVIYQRLSLYEQDPRLLRLIQWQMLEDQDELEQSKRSLPSSWLYTIENLQKQKKVKKEYSPSLIVIYIYSLINGLIFDVFSFFSKNEKERELYIEMLVNEVTHTFKFKS